MGEVLLALGAIVLAGLGADLLGRRTRLPRVTLLLLLGLAVGPAGLALLPSHADSWYPLAANFALVMVAFLLGGELTLGALRDHGRDVILVSVTVVGATAVMVAAGLFLLGFSAPVAILLAVIATSTAPAAVADVVRETHSSGPITRILLGVVAVDDAWGLILLSVGLASVLAMSDPALAGTAMLTGTRDIVGAIGVGCVVGVPMAFLTGRIEEGEPTQAEAIAGVLLSGGIALTLGVSHLLAAMTTGVVVANLATHQRRPFRAIEGIEWPFMVVFFVLSGATLDLGNVRGALGLIAALILTRLLGRLFGGVLAAQWTHEPRSTARWLGPALLPQAGVAIGMALVVSQELPHAGSTILTATMASTVFFELIGPICTRQVLEKAGETRTE